MRGILLLLLLVACTSEHDARSLAQRTSAGPFSTAEAPATRDRTLAALPSPIELNAALVQRRRRTAAGRSADSLRPALAMYSLSLITPHAPFERYLRGEHALDPPEQRGYDSFRDYGCVSCHQGIDIGGNLVEQFSIARNDVEDRDALSWLGSTRWSQPPPVDALGMTRTLDSPLPAQEAAFPIPMLWVRSEA